MIACSVRSFSRAVNTFWMIGGVALSLDASIEAQQTGRSTR
jgi:hypothetical protein